MSMFNIYKKNAVFWLIGDDVQPRTKWYANVLGVSAFGIFILSLGIYGLFASLRGSSPLLIAGAVSVFVGLRVLWKAVQMIRPLHASPQVMTCECPFCGAIVPKDIDVCQKCGREIVEQGAWPTPLWYVHRVPNTFQIDTRINTCFSIVLSCFPTNSDSPLSACKAWRRGSTIVFCVLRQQYQSMTLNNKQ
jgi:hypothetical protein